MDNAFAEVQQRLLAAWQANLPGAETHHVVVALPSYSLDPLILSHYGHRIPPLEHRYLYIVLLLRDPHARVVYVSSIRPPDYLLASYFDLLPADIRADARSRLTLVSLDDVVPRSLTEKILERPDVVAGLRRVTHGVPAFIEPWNVSVLEAQLAVEIDVPLYGADPSLWSLGTKRGGRQVFADEGVPHPAGGQVERPSGVVDVAVALRRSHPDLGGVIIKLDDSASGDGNAVIDLTGLPAPGHPDERLGIANRLKAVPGWYFNALQAAGGIVEEMIDGDDFRSPSVQLVVAPTGDVEIVSTHDQVLGGHAGQVYQGCSFPADAEYAAQIAELASPVGRRLAREGVRGRFSVDFVGVCREGRWDMYAIEINLRKGGTTHPFDTTRFLTGGTYDPGSGSYRALDGDLRYYLATDNLVDPDWRRLDPARVLQAIRDAECGFASAEGVGVVPHLLTGLPVDGRFGLTAIGRSRDEAARHYARIEEVVRDLA
jgi:hypothetical protein